MQQIVVEVQPAFRHKLSCGHSIYTYGSEPEYGKGETVFCPTCEMVKKAREKESKKSG